MRALLERLHLSFEMKEDTEVPAASTLPEAYNLSGVLDHLPRLDIEQLIQDQGYVADKSRAIIGWLDEEIDLDPYLKQLQA